MIERNTDQTKYAVKAFSKEYLKNQKNGKESLINEIHIMQAVEHKHVIELVEIHESMNSLYLVMELLEGGEIFNLNKGKLDNDSTFAIMKSILHALVAMAKMNIMHRDLKPDNIILKHKNVPIPENCLKLVDFGLATYADVDEYLFKRCGTPGFVAPEVINAKKGVNVHYSPKCDVFSVGIIFFFMLTGTIPYDGEDFEEVLENNKKAVINFKIKELKNVTPIALDLLKQMLVLDPDMRPTASECLKHEYFVSQAPSMIFDDEDEEMDYSANLMAFQGKYKGLKKEALGDSIHFNANPTINGKLDTIDSTMKFGSKGSNMSKNTDPGKISSFHGGNKSKTGKKDPNAARPSIYKYALMKGNKGVDIQKELEKMVNASMDSYKSGDSGEDSDSDSNSGNDQQFRTTQQGKSRFAQR